MVSFSRRLRQMKGMVQKNYLFSLRSWKTTLLQILAPLIFTVLLLLLDLIPKNPDDNPYNPFPEELNPDTFHYGQVPLCLNFNDLTCVSVRYALDSTDPADYQRMEEVIGYLMEDNGFVEEDVKYMGTSADLIAWLANHPNTTGNGLVFHSFQPSNMSYTILFNATLSATSLYDIRTKPDSRNELQISVDKSLMRLYLQQPVDLQVSYRPFPQLGYNAGQSVTSQYGTVFFFCGIMFQYVIILYNICMEKDLQLRRGLRVIGLKDSVYWLSWLASAILITLLAVFVLLASGYASRLAFFVNTDFSVLLVLFFLYSAAIISLAFFSSVFIQKAKSSLNLGMGVFVLGLLFVAIVGNTYTQQALYDDELVTPAVPIIFQFIPPFNLAKAMADINDAASDYDTSGLPKNSTHYTWDRLYVEGCIPKTENGETYCKPMPPTVFALYYLIMNFFFFGFFTWYLDQVLPGVHGESRPFYFPFTPSYWGCSKKSSKNAEEEKTPLLSNEDSQVNSSDDGEPEDPDVKQERNRTRSGQGSLPIKIVGLEKTFNNYSLKSLFTCKPSKSFRAVKGLDLGIEESQLLSLLGHNGAAKSTTINMLTGLLTPSKGNCYIYGSSVLDDMDEIRDMIGLCPQHDILWNDLTAREHMQMFCDLRGIPREEIPGVIKERLDDVQLLSVADNCVGTFSGGMKRRLSVALSFIGDPKVVFLDEPTTGMDPYVRRDVWNLILRLKKGRVIMMTTHSMEEADVLGDKIAIMALGKLIAVGTSTHLKNRFAGYKLSIVTKKEASTSIQNLVMSDLEGSVFQRETVVEGVSYLVFSLSPNVTKQLVPFLKKLEADKINIQDFSVSQTTLEEVFVNVTEHTEYLASTQKEN